MAVIDRPAVVKSLRGLASEAFVGIFVLIVLAIFWAVLPAYGHITAAVVLLAWMIRLAYKLYELASDIEAMGVK